MRLSYRLGSLLLLALFAVFLLSRNVGSLPNDKPLQKPSKPASRPRDIFTHINTKLRLPQSRILGMRPSRETTEIVVPNDRIIVMARLAAEDVSWVSGDLTDWRTMIYTVDDQNAPRHTPMNKGRESLAYLQFIVDHYHDLPSAIVFLHSHRDGYPGAWHTDNDALSNVESVRNLRMDVLHERGYLNLRCQHTPGCPVSISPPRDDSRGRLSMDRVYKSAWKELFNNTRIPETISVPCCSQFAVTKDQVLQRPLSDYVWFYQWVLGNDLADTMTSGVLENTWHIIFGQDPVYCPDEAQCYEDVYGVLDGVLDGISDGISDAA